MQYITEAPPKTRVLGYVIYTNLKNGLQILNPGTKGQRIISVSMAANKNITIIPRRRGAKSLHLRHYGKGFNHSNEERESTSVFRRA
ncbi:hypothetical protein NL676_014414 [Syzygium grande]|nr:hypothetical protein NL676_014414 [Syzygium grande]